MKMQFPIKILLTMAGALIALNSLPSSRARSITLTLTDSVRDPKSSDGFTAVTTALEAATLPMDHIRRPRQLMSCQIALADVNVLHMPCDMDLPNLPKYIETLPNQCICAYNTRFHSEQDYRNFKILQLESFFFGQYAERLKRFELDPHQFDYRV
ncbi:PREDICTED: uncharacterized protein LOC108616312 isoform X1 [Drosophila arizonae]|uniref:Uncharacterized protein LOC108616312 isoform X1 n=2 Tax=Drosophila arizonae TaxID=7263 RepID=A0ABM1PI72_DROAR|nr:PREDICTED: uncharacterized protein LOC108616312 isoform X1 [Drosophila arizonae]